MDAKILFNKILDLAIRGRLTEQLESDGSAQDLIDQIENEKKREIEEYNKANPKKTQKKYVAPKPIPSEDIPFEIPENWKWVRIEEITDSYIGLTYSPSEVSNDGIIVLRSSNIQDGKLEFTDIVRVKKDISEKLMVEKGDIIICARNGSQRLVGKSALVDNIFEPMTFGAFMCICKSQFNTYIHKYLQTSLFFEQLVFSSNTKEIYQLTQNRFNKFLIPLPPLSEQKRIVAKLEEIFGKIDKIKNGIPKSEKVFKFPEAEGQKMPVAAEGGTQFSGKGR